MRPATRLHRAVSRSGPKAATRASSSDRRRCPRSLERLRTACLRTDAARSANASGCISWNRVRGTFDLSCAAWRQDQRRLATRSAEARRARGRGVDDSGHAGDRRQQARTRRSPRRQRAAAPRREPIENLTAAEADMLEAICARIIPTDANGPGRARGAGGALHRSRARRRARRSRARRTAPASRRSIATADRRGARRSSSCRRAIRIRC